MNNSASIETFAALYVDNCPVFKNDLVKCRFFIFFFNMHCKLSAILYHVWASYYIVLLKLCLLVLLGLVLERTSRWWLSVRPTVSHRWTHTASMKKLDARLCPFQSAFLQHTLYLNRSVWREHSEQSKLQQHPPVFTSLTRHCSSPVRIFQSERWTVPSVKCKQLKHCPDCSKHWQIFYWNCPLLIRN